MPTPSKQEQAISLGADHFLEVSDRDSIRQAEYYFDLLYITAHGGFAWDDILTILKKKGTIALSGFPPVKFNSVDLVAHELIITGSFLGTQTDMRNMLQFAQLANIQPMIEIMPMSQVNQAIQKLKKNQARYRIVLVNDII